MTLDKVKLGINDFMLLLRSGFSQKYLGSAQSNTLAVSNLISTLFARNQANKPLAGYGSSRGRDLYWDFVRIKFYLNSTTRYARKPALYV